MNRRRGQPRGSAPLARRLRELREQHWPGSVVTQKALAEALGGGKPLSVSSISSYENEDTPSVPPEPRLRAYATFFATERSLADGVARLLPDDQLTDAERSTRDELYVELLSLRPTTVPTTRIASAAGVAEDLWSFPEGELVRLLCGRLEGMSHQYASPTDPNYTELLSYADLDALVELFGHIRMRNPTCDVRFLLHDRLTSDDLSSHLVLVGGIGLNRANQWILNMTDLPIRQVTSEEVMNGEVFEVIDGTAGPFMPKVTEDLGLVEDVGLLARLQNPLNTARTLTVCNGVYSRGVLGTVRSLTDAKLRDRNEAYLSERFASQSRFCILMRVPVLGGKAVTPDLPTPENRLYEWSEEDSAAGRTGLTKAG
jgi:transcriptional regulator with XRE-family HTH domain